jgi:Cu(I)/Ag(I) efflux system membrane fusion protein
MRLKPKIGLLVGLCALIVAVGLVTLRHRNTSQVMQEVCGTAKPSYWYDPMHPEKHFDKPGKSPFMDMQLLPKYA